MERRFDNEGLGYLGNYLIKRDGVQHTYTPEEIQEYMKCKNDPSYFARTHCKVISLDRGLVPFDLYPYQEKMFKHFRQNRYSIVLACRQSGKSISVCAYLTWFAIFHADKTVAIAANKGATAREMLARITLILENLPFFLQPGCKTLNKGSIKFSNNSKIKAYSTTSSGLRSESINLLYLDEFAFVPGADAFYTSTYPVISSGKTTQVIITSTMNGMGNLFYRLWQGAVNRTNEFSSFRVDWWDVPGRDEKWKAETIRNTSELQFAQEFGNQPIGSSTTLISADALLRLVAQGPIRLISAGDSGQVKVFFPPEKDHKYFLMVDVAKGRGQDYSTINVIDVTTKPFKQVAIYRNNIVSPIVFPNIIVSLARRYNSGLVIIENNDSGQVVCNGVYYDLEYENVFVESAVKSGGVGVTMTKKVKRIGCSNLADLIEQNKLQIFSAETIHELSTFEQSGDSYAASDGNHDDLVMNLVLFAWFLSTPFAELSDGEFKNMLFSEKLKQIEDDLVPAGFFGNHEPSAPASQKYYDDLLEQNRKWQHL